MNTGHLPDPAPRSHRPGGRAAEVIQSGRDPRSPSPGFARLVRSLRSIPIVGSARPAEQVRRRLSRRSRPPRRTSRPVRTSRLVRASRLARPLLVVAAGGIALRLVAPPPGPAPSAESAPPPAARGEAAALTLVASQAVLPGPLRDYVRPDTAGGSCPQAPAGYSPTDAVGAALRHTLPGFAVVDVSRTYNQTPGMCALLVRARDGTGTIAVVQVIAPGRPGLTTQVIWLSTATRSDGVTATKYVSASTASGWAIHVGTTGPSRAQPTQQRLFDLAQDPQLLW